MPPLNFQLESLDGLEDANKALYKEVDGKFVLDVDGLPEPKTKEPDDYSKLRESVKALEANNQKLMSEKVEARKLAEAAELEAAKKSGDVEAVENSWKEKYNKLDNDFKAGSEEFQHVINELTVGAAATSMSADLAVKGSADVLQPHIRQRLSVEINDKVPSIRVLDKDGRPSAMTLKELEEEFRNMKSFAPIIEGSKASGAGGIGQGGEDRPGVVSREKYRNMSPQEQRDFVVKKGGRIED